MHWLLRLALPLASLLFSHALFSQISKGGRPLSLEKAAADLPTPDAPIVVLSPLPIPRLLAEDAEKPALENRFAAPVDADFGLDQAGSWHDLPNGDRLWRCAVEVPSAYGLILLFDELVIPEGATLFAYTPDGETVFGAYTHESCLPSGKFTIGVLPTPTAWLEYREPAAVRGQGKLHLNRVDGVYKQATVTGSGFGSGWPCQRNVNCAEGANWQTEKKGVARILMVFKQGAAWCSGTLIANTAGTPVPYFLTAFHCQRILDEPAFDQWIFDFQYEMPACANLTTEPTRRSVLGCRLVSSLEATDYMLLQLNPLPANAGFHFNGWSRSTNVGANATFIHHPSGDVKKITVDNQAAAAYAMSVNWGTGFGVSDPNTHWVVRPDVGTYQGGSSGSPLFSADKKVIGQLHGGFLDSCISASPALFGMFHLSWNTGTTPATRLKDWLDPNNQNAMSQNGYPQPAALLSISGKVKTANDVPMPNVIVSMNTGTGVLADTTDADGKYAFGSIPPGTRCQILPKYDVNDINGVSTFDLAVISKHILGIQPLTSPWTIIAADINASNSVTVFDIAEARKLVLGLYDILPDNLSWRFFPAITTFTEPTNPFGSALPTDGLLFNSLQQNIINVDFIGVKVGDVDNTAKPGQ